MLADTYLEVAFPLKYLFSIRHPEGKSSGSCHNTKKYHELSSQIGIKAALLKTTCHTQIYALSGLHIFQYFQH